MAVVDHPDPQVAIRLVDLHAAVFGAGVPGHIRQRLGDDPERGLLDVGGQQRQRIRAQSKLGPAGSAHAERVRRLSQRTRQTLPIKCRRSKAGEHPPDLADGRVRFEPGSLQQVRHRCRISPQRLAGRLESQGDAGQRRPEPVMQVAAEPIALGEGRRR